MVPVQNPHDQALDWCHIMAFKGKIVYNGTAWHMLSPGKGKVQSRHGAAALSKQKGTSCSHLTYSTYFGTQDVLNTLLISIHLNLKKHAKINKLNETRSESSVVNGVDKEKGENDFTPKRTIHGAWAERKGAEVFLSISEMSDGLRNVKYLLCLLDCPYRCVDIKDKAEFS